MEPKFTKGPYRKGKWGQLENPEGKGIFVWDAGIGVSSRDDESEANGHLFRASWDMYAALDDVRTTLTMLKRNVETEIRKHDGLFRWEGVPEAIQAKIDELDAALSRARGETK